MHSFVETLPGRPEFDVVNADWAACMIEHGFHESTPALLEQRFNDEHVALMEANDYTITSELRDEHQPAELGLAD